MSRDLYGTMLSRALNRGAPQGHFAAYIQPDEAAMLRSQGGGVAPGGGQYMTNGVPSFFSPGDAEFSEFEAAEAEAAAVAEGLEYSRNATMGSLRPPELAPTSTVSAPTPARVERTPVLFDPLPPAPEVFDNRHAMPPAPDVRVAMPTGGATGYNIGLEQAKEAQEASKGGDRRTQQMLNLDVILLDPDLTPEQRAALLDRNISNGGIGRYAPGATLARQGALPTEIAHVMQKSSSGFGYAVLNPSGGRPSPVSVPRGYNMGWAPSLAATLIGAVAPGATGLLANAALLGTGFPTAGKRFADWVGIPSPSDVLRGAISRAWGPSEEAAAPREEGRLAQVLGAGRDLLSLAPGGGDPGQQQAFGPPDGPAPQAPADSQMPLLARELLSDGRVPQEEPFVSEVTDPEVLDRLSNTAERGLWQVAESPGGLPEGAFGDSSFAPYRGGYFIESPAGSGEYHSVGPPGTSSVAQVYRREQIPPGSRIAPPGTQYADVFGVSRSDPSRRIGKQPFGLA